MCKRQTNSHKKAPPPKRGGQTTNRMQEIYIRASTRLRTFGSLL